MAYVRDKLGSADESVLSPEEVELVGKLGGRMVDLETVREAFRI
jgi:hypothetical protein